MGYALFHLGYEQVPDLHAGEFLDILNTQFRFGEIQGIEIEGLKKYIKEREKALAEKEESARQKEQALNQILLDAEKAMKQQIDENKVLVIQKGNLVEQLRFDHTAIYKAWLRQGNRSEAAMERMRQKLEKRIQDSLGKRSKIPPGQQWI
jgi:hypothetical protein